MTYRNIRRVYTENECINDKHLRDNKYIQLGIDREFEFYDFFHS